MKKVVYILLSLFSVLMVGCIKNDIPYPYIELKILDIELEGQKSARIDNENRCVTFDMYETADLSKSRITKFSITDDAVAPIGVDSVIDLRQNYSFDLSLYNDITWTLIAKQDIERYFNVEGQIGESRIAVNGKKAVASVAIGSNLKKINITGLKLGPEGSTITPEISAIKDFSDPFNYPKVTVSYRDVVEEWELIVITTDIIVETKQVYPWAKIAWLNGQCKEGMLGGFEYCLNDGQDNWISLDPNVVVQDGNSFSAKLTGLQPETAYKYRALADTEYGAEVDFVTGAAVELPNGSFDTWWLNDKVWSPWTQGEDNFWDTGNKGSSTMGKNVTIPSDNEKWDSKSEGNGAKLMSQFVGIGAVGKFAAGNIYVGNFRAIDGTDGILDMGKPFNAFPTRLEGYYKYFTKPIDKYNNETAHMAGKPDTCSIFIALGDWDIPVEIRTKPSTRKLFDKNDPNIIAYSEMYSGESTDGYVPFSLELDYRELGRTPKYILIVISASKYGDFFTGADGATMWVDELSLKYD